MSISHPEIQYNGPAEFKPAWDKFASAYAIKGSYNITALNLLNELAFNDGVQTVLRNHCRGKENFRDTKGKIEDCARDLSYAAYSDASLRPFEQKMMDTLIHRWIELEKTHGLYPPPPIGDSNGVKQEETDKIKAKREDLLKTPEGALIANTLRMLLDEMINAHINMARPLFENVSESVLFLVANNLFEAALFKYKSDGGATFGGYVQRGLENSLKTEIYAALHNKNIPTDNDTTKDIEGYSTDAWELDTTKRILHTELKRCVKNVLDRLPAEQRKILTLRFGLQDGVEHTLQEIGNEYGYTAEWARKHESRAMESFFALYRKETLPENKEDNWAGLVESGKIKIHPR